MSAWGNIAETIGFILASLGIDSLTRSVEELKAYAKGKSTDQVLAKTHELLDKVRQKDSKAYTAIQDALADKGLTPYLSGHAKSRMYEYKRKQASKLAEVEKSMRDADSLENRINNYAAMDAMTKNSRAGDRIKTALDNDLNKFLERRMKNE